MGCSASTNGPHSTSTSGTLVASVTSKSSSGSKFSDSLVVTTGEASEENLLTRIYWLEGTGFAGRDYQAVIDLVQSSIEPDTWEKMGGRSTISPVASTRPALLVGAVYTVHEQIDKLLKTLRETHFGNDPVLEPVQVPKPAPMQGGVSGTGGFM